MSVYRSFDEWSDGEGNWLIMRFRYKQGLETEVDNLRYMAGEAFEAGYYTGYVAREEEARGPLIKPRYRPVCFGR